METPGYAPPIRRTSAGNVTFDAANVAVFDPGGETGPGGGGTFAVIPYDEDELAWAIFRTPLAADDRPTTLHCTCAAADDGAGGTLPLSYWIGIYNFSSQRWEWEFKVPGQQIHWTWAGQINFDVNTDARRGRYSNRSEEAYLAIVVQPPSQVGQTQTGVQVTGGSVDFLNTAEAGYFRTAPLPADVAGLDMSTPGEITLNFGQGGDDGDEVRIQRREANGPWQQVGTVQVGDSFTDSDSNEIGDGPTLDRAYFYRAQAVTIDGGEFPASFSNEKATGGWAFTTLDASVPGVGIGDANVAYTSLAEINGHPAIAFQDNDGGGHLKFAISSDRLGLDPQAWNVTLVAGDGASEDWGQYCSLAAVEDSPGVFHPAIAHYNQTPHDHLQYSYAADTLGATWDPPITIDPGAGTHLGYNASLAVIAGRPAIASQSSVVLSQLWYVRAATSSGAAAADWQSPQVTFQIADATDPCGYGASLVDNGGIPAISYFTEAPAELRLALGQDADGATWNVEPLDTLNTATDMTSCALTDIGIGVAYYDFLNGAVKFAEWDGGSATVDVVDPNFVGPYVSLAAIPDVGGGTVTPGIAYYHDNNPTRRLKYQSAHAGGWNAGTAARIDNPDDPLGGGAYCDLTVINGRPCISYQGWQNQDLRFAVYFQPN
jgi:hypothetical protein